MKKTVLDFSKIKSLVVASHEIGINGRKAKPPNNPSEWAWAFAAYSFPKGKAITIDEFKVALIHAIHYEEMSKMIDRGEAYLVLDKDGDLALILKED